ncbi:hypothetical protein ACFE04_000786 [Oxalis oulophora]
MGSSSSQLSSRRSPDRFKFSSLICGGGSSSHTPLEMEDRLPEVLISSSEHCEPINNQEGYLAPESSSNHRTGSMLSGLNISIGTTCEHSSNEASVDNHMDELNQQVTEINNHDSASVSHSFDLPNTPSDGFIEAVPSGFGFLVNREQNQGDESLLQVDVVSISSNVFSSSGTNHETRTNSRQIFRDAFSRRNSGRQLDSPTIIFSAADRNGSESNDRWVVDFGDDFFEDVLGYGYIGTRLNRLHERRRHSRSMIWESSRGDLDENIRRTARCATGLHPEGSCSCDSFLARGDSSGRSSISRIVMLAETLFEVLDEIHRQPVSLSLSIPAPESVVDSLPLKDHKKKDHASDGDDFAQCNICLADYEEGDKIRVLPCHHEYHKSCVDKWLKEIHGVCPLCRGDVRQGDSQHSAPQQEIHSAW